MEVTSRSAIVTGAAGGIGAAIAQRLLERGASVTLTDLDGARLEATVAALAADHPGRIVGMAGDASADDDLRHLLATAEEAHGPVELYFANAGVGGAPTLDATDAEWQQTLDVNVLAHVRAARLLVPGWVERGTGYFIATASAAGLLTQLGSATYSVTKHAAVGFAEWLAVTYGAQGVRVSCLCPMDVDTAMLRAGERSVDPTERLAARAVTEAGGVLAPLDVADTVLDAVAQERFLILPHVEVLEMYRRKGADYDRWIRGMQRYASSLASGAADGGV